jgi:hypothetical protein
LEHVIPRCSIESVEAASYLWRQGIQLNFTDASGERHAIVVFSRNLNGLLRALGEHIAKEV